MIIALAARNIWSALPWIVLRYRPVNEPGPRARHVDDHVTKRKIRSGVDIVTDWPDAFNLISPSIRLST
jgi:hypothetical protein